mmetsp:Transcript_30705/g.94019  ORF Transcript_30705/g.94019 Transcript_30705/m.94019 type:complete len:126 (-) Transcript_30705:246-623(-)
MLFPSKGKIQANQGSATIFHQGILDESSAQASPSRSGIVLAAKAVLLLSACAILQRRFSSGSSSPHLISFEGATLRASMHFMHMRVFSQLAFSMLSNARSGARGRRANGMQVMSPMRLDEAHHSC